MERGTLWDRILTTSEQAVRTGALLRFPTSASFIEEGGIRYFVRVLEALKQKDEAKKEQQAPAAGGKTFDPFLPPEQDLTVGDVTANHIAVLNKDNVLDHHLLLVTRHYEEQEMLLTFRDLQALWFCLAEYDCLGFYNGGAEAGASQHHKHLQIVPLPLASPGPAIPLAPLFEGCTDHVPAFPFLHGFRRLPRGLASSPSDAAVESWKIYSELLRSVGMDAPTPGRLTPQSRPYCLLVAREWILLVPRSKEFFEDISLNCLAYAGSFFVRTTAQLDRLRTVGMMQALAEVAVPKKTFDTE